MRKEEIAAIRGIAREIRANIGNWAVYSRLLDQLDAVAARLDAMDSGQLELTMQTKESLVERQQKALARTRENVRQRGSGRRAQVVQLPLWPGSHRTAPNAVLRSALFPAIQGKTRRYLMRERIAATRDYQISFTGSQFDQADLEVWEEIVHLCREHPLGTRCDFSAHGLLKAIDRATGKANHEWLKDSIARLTACAVEIEFKHKGEEVSYGGSMIQEWVAYDVGKRFSLALNPRLLALYQDGYTAVDVAQRARLRGKPLQLWLYSYFSTATKVHPVKVETLHRLSGSNTRELREFRRQLRTALRELGHEGFVTAAIDASDLVRTGGGYARTGDSPLCQISLS